eukprot:TRINITY_DN13548_c0_g1_i4.p1 TRINITY_DN13548_c0_g1~~TRINITY_DN13548_c0_g1_i4.p1  ORF type:complete len:946 (-),score=205.02 TRINITY_DN13548_c0_g1_i4:91-2928(-)
MLQPGVLSAIPGAGGSERGAPGKQGALEVLSWSAPIFGSLCAPPLPSVQNRGVLPSGGSPEDGAGGASKFRHTKVRQGSHNDQDSIAEVRAAAVAVPDAGGKAARRRAAFVSVSGMSQESSEDTSDAEGVSTEGASSPQGRPAKRRPTIVARGPPAGRSSASAEAAAKAQAFSALRSVLIPGLEAMPFPEWDAAFPRFRALVASEMEKIVRSELAGAREHYRQELERFPTNYVARVNAACCDYLLDRPREAVVHLTHAVELIPTKAVAYLNLVLCFLKLQDHDAASSSACQALQLCQELSEDERALLMRCRARAELDKMRQVGEDVRPNQRSARPKSARGGSKGFVVGNLAAAAACIAESFAPGAASRAADANREELGRGILAQKQEARLMEEVQETLNQLRKGRENERTTPASWGRRHMYSGDYSLEVDAEGWAHLTMEELQGLRAAFAAREDIRRAGRSQAPDAMAPLAPLYDNVKSLHFFRRLQPAQAIELLNGSDLIEVSANTVIFRQGDVADFMYVVVSGSARSDLLDEEYGEHPVTVCSFYDGQLFGENVGTTNLRASTVVTQELTVLLKFSLNVYLRAMAADTPGSVSGDGRTQVGDSIATADSRVAERPTSGSGADLARRIRGLLASPFRSEQPRDLELFAANVQEHELRYEDVIVAAGSEPSAAYLLIDGVCKISLPADAPVEADNDVVGIDEQAQAANGDSTLRAAAGAARDFDCETRRKLSSTAGPLSACNNTRKNTLQWRPRRVVHAVLPQEPSIGRRPRTSLAQKHQRPSAYAVVAALPRPPHNVNAPVPPPREVPRKPGTPRRGAPWAQTLRAPGAPAFRGVPPGREIDMGLMYPGTLFAFRSLVLQHDEVPPRSQVTVRVDSCSARILIVHREHLLYLNERITKNIQTFCETKEDPIRPLPDAVSDARRLRRCWATEKQQVLHRTLALVD